ncbi:MAG: anion permease, partial [Planctomycetota bacterium]
MLFILMAAGVFCLAWSNGANDNFKGVATLYGSRALSFRPALLLAGSATLAGSLVSIFLAENLIHSFNGGGLLTHGGLSDAMLAATALSAGATIFLATRLGMPTSTTHALIGALAGTALVSRPDDINLSKLMTSFAQPLLLSPVASILLAMGVYGIFRRLRSDTGLSADSCVCVGEMEMAPSRVPAGNTAVAVMSASETGLGLSIGSLPSCGNSFTGGSTSVRAGSLINSLHVFSAGSVCFSRAINDTPKIAALLLSAQAVSGCGLTMEIMATVALAMVLGGLLQGRRVAQTISQRITELNIGQGFTANMVTAGLVIGASQGGFPVSTTHVSCGAIFGIGLMNGKRDLKTIIKNLLAWVTTLPQA